MLHEQIDVMKHILGCLHGDKCCMMYASCNICCRVNTPEVSGENGVNIMKSKMIS